MRAVGESFRYLQEFRAWGMWVFKVINKSMGFKQWM